jgi:hypothetical protein
VSARDTALLSGLTWDELVRDRRPRRLKRDKHFRGDVRSFQHEAAVAARDRGCTARVVRDDFVKNAYVWVQFFDLELPLGDPCSRCGSRRILRTHQHFGRCPACDATIAFLPRRTSTDPSAPPESPRLDAKTQRKIGRLLQRRLRSFDNVRIALDPEQSNDQQEIFYGRGDYRGEPMLIRVLYPLKEGARQPHPDDPDDDLHFIKYWELAPYARAAELGIDQDTD